MRIEARIQLEGVPSNARVMAAHVREGLSVVSEIVVRFAIEEGEVQLPDVLNKPAWLVITDTEEGWARAFHGLVEAAESLDSVIADKPVYEVRIRPSMGRLARNFRTRSFLDTSVVDVATEVLGAAGLVDDRLTTGGLKRDYQPRELCVQWRESDLAFVSRLFEEAGIFYWFEHDEEGHILALADSESAHLPIDGDPVLLFSDRTLTSVDRVTDLVFRTSVTHNAYIGRDWNWEAPAKPVESASRESDDAGMVRYEYPAGFSLPADGARASKDRLAAMMGERYRLFGWSNCHRLAPGRTFCVAQASPSLFNQEYLVVAVEHVFDGGEGVDNASPAAASDAAGGASPRVTPVNEAYRVRFEAMPTLLLPFRAPRVTPRPRIHGLETAFVTGPPGEEIHVDKFGRIKVRFAWDAEHPSDDSASCWLRVQQQNTDGSMILPRVGWELMVAFLDGDPDRPMAMQKYYNSDSMPPYPLPANKTQGSLESSSSPGGAALNSIRAQDSSGGMQLAFTAAKDLMVTAGTLLKEHVTENATIHVGGPLETTVGTTEVIAIQTVQSHQVKLDFTEETTTDKTVTIAAADQWKASKTLRVSTKGDRSDTIGAAQVALANKISEEFQDQCQRTVGVLSMLNAANSINEAVGGNKTETVGVAKLELLGGSKTENIGLAKQLTSGAVALTTGKDVGVNTDGAFAATAAGIMKETCGEAYALTAKQVQITGAASATFKAGGTKFELSGGSLTLDASSLQGDGSVNLSAKGPINYQDP